MQLFSIDEKPVLFVNGENNDFPDFESTQLDLNNPILNVYKKRMCSIFDKVIPQTTFKRLNSRYGNRVDYDLLDSESVARFFNEDYKILTYIEFNDRTRCSTSETGKYEPEIYRAFEKLGVSLIVAPEAMSSQIGLYDQLCKDYEEMSSYPYDGYIVETTDRIIVKI